MIIDDLRTILNNEVGVVLKSPDLLLLMLRTYSKLFLNGEPPRACEKCHRNYYEQLKTNGMESAILTEKIKTRTCVPAWVGRKYSTKVFEFLIPDLMYDEKAIEMLKLGALKESDFKVLPHGYKNQPEIEKEVEKDLILPEQKTVSDQKRGRKPKK